MLSLLVIVEMYIVVLLLGITVLLLKQLEQIKIGKVFINTSVAFPIDVGDNIP